MSHRDFDAAFDAGNWAAVGAAANTIIANSSVASASSGCSLNVGNMVGTWACQLMAPVSRSRVRELGRAAGLAGAGTGRDAAQRGDGGWSDGDAASRGASARTEESRKGEE